MQEGQLDRVGDLLDLGVEAAHVGVGDVGHLLEHQLLDLGPGQLLQHQARAGVDQHAVARPQVHADDGVGQLHHPLLVGPAEHQGPAVVLQHLFEGHHLSRHLGAPSHDHVERLVEDHLDAPFERLVGQVGVQGHAHLAPGREDVDGAVVVVAEQRPVGRRRLGELLHLLPQGGDVLAPLAGCSSTSRSGRRPGPVGPWPPTTAPRGCAPAWGRPGACAGAGPPRPRGSSPAPAARRARTRRAPPSVGGYTASRSGRG